jgi:gamma-glutamyl phosphate reductase
MTDVDSSKKIQSILKEIERVYNIAVPIDYVYKENAREDQLLPYKVRKVTDYL